MSRRALALAALATALVTAPAALHAQMPVKFGLAAGATLPTGDAKDGYDWGYHLGAQLAVKPPLSPLGVRAEVMLHTLKGKEINDPIVGTFTPDDPRIIAGIVNAEVGLGGIGVKPYLIGGIGYYNLNFGEGTDSQNKIGFNAGAGLDFGLAGFSAFAEARYHRIQTDGDSKLSVIPISFGLRF